MEFWDEDEDGPQPYRCGSEITSNEHLELLCGLSIGAMLFEEFEGVALPQVTLPRLPDAADVISPAALRE